MKRILLVGLFAAASLAVMARANAFDLTVEITGASNPQGQVMAAVYAAEDVWLKPAGAVQAAMAPAAASAPTILTYRGLPAGRYALSAFHDGNGNGRLDTNPVGQPLEAYGFSRDARGRMGPPSFADAAIELQGDTTLRIQLR